MPETPNMVTAALPGIEPYDESLQAELAAAYRNKGDAYRPRSRHLNADGSAKYTNRLLLETSPYLLQHAHNPVNWYPWGAEAFDAARRRHLPILLSVGYSTCHWCHVMEEESFEDVEIAEALNRHYIAIKVDREERPDIDAVYMGAVQALTGTGGWPMTVWLTPDGKPFYGASYLPPRTGDRGAPYGFLTLLQNLAESYRLQREKVTQASAGLAQAVAQILAPQPGGDLPGAALLTSTVDRYRDIYDPQYGGVRGAPKFPSSLPIRLLLRHYRHSGEAFALEMAATTLKRMAAGGMRDQVGGGFHRYATDAQWLVPHFEIMLYDNALLTIAYLEAFQVTRDPQFRVVAEDILHFLRRDMASPEGAFYAATDADSLAPNGHLEEGRFFTWTPAEIGAVLSEDEAKLVTSHFGITAAGNFEGRSILHVAQPLATVAEALGLDLQRAQSLLRSAREKLYRARAGRPAPHRDEKILSAWNGLAISAFARAGLVLDEPSFTAIARTAASFLLDKLCDGQRLYRSYKDGRARHAGFLEDYAFTVAGLLDLYETTGETHWLQQALLLDRVLAQHYEDGEHGGFFRTGDDQEQLLAQEKPAFDGAEPSGNSVALLNLLRLHELTGEDRYRQRAENGLRAFSLNLQSNPLALSEMLLALEFYCDKVKAIIVVTPEGERDSAAPMLAALRQTFLPNRVLVVVEEGSELERHAKLVPQLQGKVALHGRATAYVCVEGSCQLPCEDAAIFARQLAEIVPYHNAPV